MMTTKCRQSCSGGGGEEMDKNIIDRFKREQYRITTISTTTSAVNGYGYLRKHEVVIEFQKRHCIKCKVVDADRLGDFCPSNNYHKMSTGWVEETRFMVDEKLLLELLSFKN